jgi:hypothetical protein
MVLAVALILIAVLVLLGTTAVMTVTTDLKISSNYRENARALYNADAGAELVVDYLRNNTVTYPTSNATRAAIDAGTCTSGACTSIAVSPPSGFSFSSTVNLYGYDVANRRFLFRMTGTGANSASKTLEMIVTRQSIVPQGADGAVAMYGEGPTVTLKGGGGGGTNIDGRDYAIPANPNCNGNACRTSPAATGALPGLFTPVYTPTVTGDLGHLAGTPPQQVGGNPTAHTEADWQAFVAMVLADPTLYVTGTLGTRANPLVTVVPSGATLNGTANGAGIMIVQNGGTFNLGGNAVFEGIVILVGNGTFTSGGTGIVYGSIVTITHPPSKTVDCNGTGDLYYSSAALANAYNSSGMTRVQRTSWLDVHGR